MNRKEEADKDRVWLLRLLFAIYILVVIRLLIFKYPYSELKVIMDTWEKGVILEGLNSANFTPFKTIKMYIRYAYMLNSFENLAGNVVVFLPFGYLLPCISRSAKNGLMLTGYAFFFSLSIELFQLFSAFGAFDVDDLMLNTLGAVIGFLVYHMNRKLFR